MNHQRAGLLVSRIWFRIFGVMAFGVIVFGIMGGVVVFAPTALHAQTLRPPMNEGGVHVYSHGIDSIWAMSDAEYDAWFAEHVMPPVDVAEAAEDLTETEQADIQLFMPTVGEFPWLSRRLGFGMLYNSNLEEMPVALQLRAGWYQDWVAQNPGSVEAGMQYVKTVRLHQDLECPIGTNYNREQCPYVLPYSYTVRPGMSQIQALAQSRPGSLWLIGNEMDRVDWGGPGNIGHQDEMLPQVYAQAYHELYHVIKAVDPTAKIAIGGIIQPTPVRLEYLSMVWDAYFFQYGAPMPVDVWNTHNFILREGSNREWGAGIPPGVDATRGAYYTDRDENGDRTYHLNMENFDTQIRALRQWMKERGQQNKPLIVSEYGILYHNALIFPSGRHSNTDDKPVIEFMLATFDYFQNTRDCEIGFLEDDCLLVQAWNWFSLDADVGYNHHGLLINSDGKTLTTAGQAYANYARQNFGALSRPYPIP